MVKEKLLMIEVKAVNNRKNQIKIIAIVIILLDFIKQVLLYQ